MEDIDFKLIIPLDSYRKIMAYTDLVESEITGFADVEYDSTEHVFRLGKVYLVEQEAAAATVEMSEEKVSEFTLQMIKKGKEQLPQCWWHSHVRMNVFFSGTDEEAIENLKNDSYILALVVNKNREMRADVIIWKPFEYRWPEIPIEIDYAADEIPETLKKEVARKVKPEKIKIKQITFGKGKKIWPSQEEVIYSSGGKRDVRTLPKDNSTAEKIIWDNNLSEYRDDELGEFVWGSVNRKLIYRDPWDIVRPKPLFGGTGLMVKGNNVGKKDGAKE